MIEVRDSAIQGRGVYASRRIRKNTWIIQYTGKLITNEEADRLYDDESMERHHTFLFVLDEKWSIDASQGGNEARYINHSCTPNCEAVMTTDNEIWIQALRGIEKGEELSYDYGYDVKAESLEEARRIYPCRCGAPECRGTILKLERAS
jgi:SET domain-containing protein